MMIFARGLKDTKKNKQKTEHITFLQMLATFFFAW